MCYLMTNNKSNCSIVHIAWSFTVEECTLEDASRELCETEWDYCVGDRRPTFLGLRLPTF
jgi:hypothetical protein